MIMILVWLWYLKLFVSGNWSLLRGPDPADLDLHVWQRQPGPLLRLRIVVQRHEGRQGKHHLQVQRDLRLNDLSHNWPGKLSLKYSWLAELPIIAPYVFNFFLKCHFLAYKISIDQVSGLASDNFKLFENFTR